MWQLKAKIRLIRTIMFAHVVLPVKIMETFSLLYRKYRNFFFSVQDLVLTTTCLSPINQGPTLIKPPCLLLQCSVKPHWPRGYCCHADYDRHASPYSVQQAPCANCQASIDINKPPPARGILKLTTIH